MVGRPTHFVFVLILAQFATSLLTNDTLLDNDVNLKGVKTRRKGSRSTSSDSGSVDKDGGATGDESLNVVFTTESDSDSEDSDGKTKTKKKKDREPKSTFERKGWRKWHRKCTKCPEDMLKKWRDPSIKWICGAYQRARRSFKSLCMMHYRNCQDGTMFTKIADHRCPNGTLSGVRPYYHHFFYDYKVTLTEEESDSDAATSTDDDSTDSTSVSDSEIEKNVPPFIFDRDR